MNERTKKQENKGTSGAGVLMRLLAGGRACWLVLRCSYSFICLFPGTLVPLLTRRLVPLFLCILVFTPIRAYAQTHHTLVVSLREVSGAGIGGATITIRDASGIADLASIPTNGQGIATVPNLRADRVRVAVSGILADGTPLSQRGQDARGIWLMLDAPIVQLDLRSELDGAVLPDPATMISPDVAFPATPAAPVVRAVVELPTAAPTPPIGNLTAIAPPQNRPALAEPSQPGQRNSFVLLGTLLLIVMFAYWLAQGRRPR